LFLSDPLLVCCLRNLKIEKDFVDNACASRPLLAAFSPFFYIELASGRPDLCPRLHPIPYRDAYSSLRPMPIMLRRLRSSGWSSPTCARCTQHPSAQVEIELPRRDGWKGRERRERKGEGHARHARKARGMSRSSAAGRSPPATGAVQHPIYF
jgi:hypothetical protein